MSVRWGPLLLAACAIAVSAGGCAPSGEERGRGAAAQAVGTDPAEVRLAAAAERAEAALTALARTAPAAAGISGRAQGPGCSPVPGHSPVPGTSPAAGRVPAALLRPVTLDWIGPVETLAETLARLAGYRFGAAGAPPVRPAMVAVAADDTPLIEVLRDAGLQAGSAATLVVDAGERTVRLDWTAERPGTGELPGTGERPGPGERPCSVPGKEGS